MLGELLIASIMQVGPFWQKGPDTLHAVRPFWSVQEESTDILWPVYTQHRNWWRFCFLVHDQWDLKSDAYQFEIMPIYWQGRIRPGRDAAGVERPDTSYWGLFPIWGRHPHLLLFDDLEFRLWPVWTKYRRWRPSDRKYLNSTAVLWPFFHWRDDGSWGFWPFYVCNHQRESFHQTVLWPIVTWAHYERDRDTGGEGDSWMVWPLWASVKREREYQWMCLPPFFSHARTPRGWRYRLPWPLVDIDCNTDRERISIFPLWERNRIKAYGGSQYKRDTVTRFLWKFIELYPDETRVFPIWTSRSDGSYLRVWPLFERMNLDRKGETKWTGVLALMPIRWAEAVDRNWASFWTLYENIETPVYTDHSLFWGIIHWRTWRE